METKDFALIQRTLNGDQNAFTRLVTKYQKWVHTLVWRKIGDFHIAEEITQDVFLKVYKKLSTLKPSDNFTGWLYVIATRHCISWLRKKRHPTTSLNEMSTLEIEEHCHLRYEAARSEASAVEHQRSIVKRLLQKLPESERTVVTLHYLAEMSCENISEFLGVSPNTVKSRLHRARARLKKQEHLLHDTSGIFQAPPTLIENIAREIGRIKPTSPSVSKPWLPWGLSFASTFLVILMMGFGTRALSRFQQPYNLDAASEMTIELVDAPVVLELARRSDALTRFGSTDIPGKNSVFGFQGEPSLIAAAQADETELPTAKPQWVQTKGPGGISRAGLFLASDRTLYATTKTGLYRLTETADAWTLVSTSGPHREFSLSLWFNAGMAEYGDILYLLTSDELLVSIDAGKTWNSLGARPQGQALALVITDTAMYLVLSTEVFRSEDVGNQWHPMEKGWLADNLPDRDNRDFRIWDALAIDNTLFVGTTWGLYRFTDAWKKLPVPTAHGIKSLAATEDRLYVGTIAGPASELYAAAFYSTDLGDSWTDITPQTREHLHKIIAATEVVPVGDTLMLAGAAGILRSDDRGKTWMNPGSNRRAIGAFPVVALDENNFYATNPSGIIRSTDGGTTWHPFMVGLVSSHVSSLFTLGNVLYALTRAAMFKSTDGGETWKSIGLDPNENTAFKTLQTKVATANGVLYASNSKLNGVRFFRLSDAGDLFLPVKGVPDFEEDPLYMEQWEKVMEAIKNNADIDKVQELRKDNQIDKVQELLKANQPRALEALRAFEEWQSNGTFTVADGTVFMEYKHKLYRWRRGETAWHDTGLEDHADISPIEGKGFTLAVSGSIVYAGKREGDLFLSLDEGDTWREVTENLAFQDGYFKEIRFAGKTAYVSTDLGVMRSSDGETWHVLTDANRTRLVMDRMAVKGMTAYGVCDSGVYQVDTQTKTWKQVTPALPQTATAFAIEGDTFYIGTKQNGVLRFQRDRR